MISEGSRDTEDWSNDAENTALHHRNNYIFEYIQAEILNCNNISQYYCFFWSNKCMLGEHKRLII